MAALYEEAFALAIFNLEQDHKKAVLFQELRLLIEILQDNRQIITFLKSPAYPFLFKKKEIKTWFQDFDEDLVNALIILVLEKKASKILAILKLAAKEFAKHFNYAQGLIYTTFALNKKELAFFEKVLSQHLKKTVILENLLNQELIAGYEIIIGDFKLVNNLKLWVDNFKNIALKSKL